MHKTVKQGHFLNSYNKLNSMGNQGIDLKGNISKDIFS